MFTKVTLFLAGIIITVNGNSQAQVVDRVSLTQLSREVRASLWNDNGFYGERGPIL